MILLDEIFTVVDVVCISRCVGLATLSPEILKDRLDDAQQNLVHEKEKFKIESDKLAAQTAALNRLYLQRVNLIPSDTKRVTGATPGNKCYISRKCIRN